MSGGLVRTYVRQWQEKGEWGREKHRLGLSLSPFPGEWIVSPSSENPAGQLPRASGPMGEGTDSFMSGGMTVIGGAWLPAAAAGEQALSEGRRSHRLPAGLSGPRPPTEAAAGRC